MTNGRFPGEEGVPEVMLCISWQRQHGRNWMNLSVATAASAGDVENDGRPRTCATWRERNTR